MNNLPESSVDDEEVDVPKTEIIRTFEGRGVGEVLEDDDSFVDYLPDPPKNTENAFGVDLEDTYLTEDQKQKVYQLFNKWERIVPKMKTDFGHTDALKHHIELTDNVPFKDSPRRIPPNLIEEVKNHIQEMLNIGVIRESLTPFSSNVV